MENKNRSGISFLGVSRTTRHLLIFTFVACLVVIATQPLQAQTYSVLHTFTGYPADGAHSEAGLIVDSAGNFYGTTASGGAHDSGTVFRVTGTGKEKLVHSFGLAPGDGGQPVAGLLGIKGTLYGPTENGGQFFAGTVFKLTKAGNETLLFSFNGGTTGNNPVAGLATDKQGNLYGTTESGGVGSFGNGGLVFKIDKAGQESTLYNFCSVQNCADGWTPKAGLILDSKGNLYGTTSAGGAHDFGTIFEVTPSGKETVLYSFGGFNGDGIAPVAGLARDSKGNLYGTTSVDGFGFGTVFKLTAAGKESVLYSFTGHADGNTPLAGLVRDSTGNLYGTTENGGTDQHGVVFKLSPNGQETVLYNFTGKADGREPVAGLALSKGSFYGTTISAGDPTCFCGTVFKLTP